MMVRRALKFAVPLVAVVGAALPARAVVPVLSEPPLKADTHWVKTDWGYQRDDLTFDLSRRWPTLIETEAYGGASTSNPSPQPPGPNMYLRMDDGELMAVNVKFKQGAGGNYALVKASVRGSECSGGSYNLYDRRHAWDGYHIIEWIAAQPWSNERVGLHGSSLSGQTAYWIATTQPPHLYAVSANLLHSDIYRDIFMVGGVQNYLFPTLWTYAAGPHRLPQDAYRRGILQNDEICQWNQTTRYSALDLPQPQNEPAWAAVRAVDDDWYHAHAALTYAANIKIPYYQQANWQDEQVGPRGMLLWKHIHPNAVTIPTCDGGSTTVAEPKKLAVSSGDHGWGQFHNRDLWNWLDIWLRGTCDHAGVLTHRVENYWETRADPPNSPYTARSFGDDWPLEGTQWPKAYLHGGGTIDFSPPSAADVGTSDTYVSVTGKQNWYYDEPDTATDVYGARGYPDAVQYVSPAVGDDPNMPLDARGNFTIAGPIMMNLWATLGGTDTDFFVSVSDVWPNGDVSYLQRGWLKASHKAVDPLRSYYADGRMVIPYMSHTNPQPISPGAPTEYSIEIFPLGHIFRPGHKLLVQIQAPPSVDGLWGYTPTHHQPSAVTILHDAAHPSWIQFPVAEPAEWTTTPMFSGCKVPGGFWCNPPSSIDR